MLSLKIFIIAWLSGLEISVSSANRELCDQQADSAFQFLRIGSTDDKENCYNLCCEHKECQVAIHSGNICFGIHCARKEVCNLISEQLSSFEGHRVDKRSTDDVDDEWMGESDGDIMQETVYNDGNTEDKGDDNSDEGDNNNIKKKREDDDENEATCSSSKFHHSYIPKRRSSFLFSNLHSGKLSLLGCSEQCCKINDCVLAFTIAKTCYGVICSGDGGCHSLNDRLPRRSIFVSTVTKVIKNLGKQEETSRKEYNTYPDADTVHHYHDENTSEENEREKEKEDEVDGSESLHKSTKHRVTPEDGEEGDKVIHNNHDREGDEEEHEIQKKGTIIHEDEDIKGEGRNGDTDDSQEKIDNGENVDERNERDVDETSSYNNEDDTVNTRHKRHEHDRHHERHIKHHKRNEEDEEEDEDDEDTDDHRSRFLIHTHGKQSTHHKISDYSTDEPLNKRRRKRKKVKNNKKHKKHKKVSNKKKRKKKKTTTKKKKKKKKKQKRVRKMKRRNKRKHTSRHKIIPPDDGSTDDDRESMMKDPTRRKDYNKNEFSGEGVEGEHSDGDFISELQKRTTIPHHSEKLTHKKANVNMYDEDGEKEKRDPKEGEDHISKHNEIQREMPNNVEMLDFRNHHDKSSQLNDDKMTAFSWENSVSNKESVAKSMKEEDINNVSPNETFFSDVSESDHGSVDMNDFEIPHTEEIVTMANNPIIGEDEGSTELMMTLPDNVDKSDHKTEAKHKTKEKKKRKHKTKHKDKQKYKDKDKDKDKDKAIMENISLLDSITEDVVNKKMKLEPDKLLNLVAKLTNEKEGDKEESKTKVNQHTAPINKEKDKTNDKQEDTLLKKMVEELENLKPKDNKSKSKDKSKQKASKKHSKNTQETIKRNEIEHEDKVEAKHRDDRESGSGSGSAIEIQSTDHIRIKYSNQSNKDKNKKLNRIPTPEEILKSFKNVGEDSNNNIHKEDIFKQFGKLKSLYNVHSMIEGNTEGDASGDNSGELKTLARNLNISEIEEHQKSTVDIDMSNNLSTIIKESTTSGNKNKKSKSSKSSKKGKSKKHSKSSKVNKASKKSNKSNRKENDKTSGKKEVVVRSHHQKKKNNKSVINNDLTTRIPKLTITSGSPTQPMQTTMTIQRTVPTVLVDGDNTPPHSVPTVVVDVISDIHPTEMHIKKMNKNPGHKSNSKKHSGKSKGKGKERGHHGKQGNSKHGSHHKIPTLNIEVGDEVAVIDNPSKQHKGDKHKGHKKKGKTLFGVHKVETIDGNGTPSKMETTTAPPTINRQNENPVSTSLPTKHQYKAGMSTPIVFNNHPTLAVTGRPITSKVRHFQFTSKPFINPIFIHTTSKYKISHVADPYMIQAGNLRTKPPLLQQGMVTKAPVGKAAPPPLSPLFNQDIWKKLLSYMQPGHTLEDLKSILKPTKHLIKPMAVKGKGGYIYNPSDGTIMDDMPNNPGEMKMDHNHGANKVAMAAASNPEKALHHNGILPEPRTHDHKPVVSPALLNHLVHGQPAVNNDHKPLNTNLHKPTQKHTQQQRQKHTIKPSAFIKHKPTTHLLPHIQHLHQPTHPLAHVLSLQPSVIKRLPTGHHTTPHSILHRTTRKILQPVNAHHPTPSRGHQHQRTTNIIQRIHHQKGLPTPKYRHTTRHHTTRHHTTRHPPTRHNTNPKLKTTQHPKLVKNVFQQGHAHTTLNPQHHKTPTKHITQPNHDLHHPSKKETPQEVVNRIINKSKKNDTTSPLDSFFSKTQHIENADKHSSIEGEKQKAKEDKLETFFKHTERKKKEPNGMKQGKKDKIHEMLPANHKERMREELVHIPGCNVLNDVWGKDFVSRPGYLFRVPGNINSSTCARKCCRRDTCHVAYFKNMVCNLVQCSNRSVCANIVPTHQNTRIVYFSKNKPDINQHFCEKNFAVGVSWEKTRTGEAALRDCPRNAFGKAKRVCDQYSKWQQPDFSNCVSQEYGELKEKMKGLGFTTSAKSLLEELDDTTTQTIDNSLIFGGDIIKASDTISGIANFLQRTKAEDIDHKDLKSFTRSVSNLLDETNKQEWLNLKPKPFGPGKLMLSLENMGLYTAERLKRAVEIKPVVTHTIILSVAKIPRALRGPYTFPNYSIPVVSQWSPRKDSILLPRNVFNNDGATMVAASNYKSLGFMLPHRWNTKKAVTFTDGFVVNSNVLSCTIRPKPKHIITPPITITLHHIKEMNFAESKCVYWDFNTGNTGSWSTEGCWLAKTNRSTTICKCNHLTHFAILSNAYDQKVNAKEQSKEKAMAMVWLGIPLSIILVVGALYTCFSWSKDPRRRHVVLMDKKPNLPRETAVETPVVSEKFEPSPKRFLYAANTKGCPSLPRSPQKPTCQRKWVVSPCKSSKSSQSDHGQHEMNGFTTPSDLEWEHAWDFLTNSNFASTGKKDVYPELKKKILGMTVDVYEKPSSPSNAGTTAKIAKWNYQDDTEWSNERIKCLSKGLLDGSETSQTAIEQTSYQTEDDVSFLYQSDMQISEGFCPVGISSPHSSLSGREGFNRSQSLRQGKNYLRISFDADIDISSGGSSRQSCSLQGSDKDLCMEDNMEIELMKQRVTKLVNSLHTQCTAYNDAYKSLYTDSVLLNSSQVLSEYKNSKLTDNKTAEDDVTLHDIVLNQHKHSSDTILDKHIFHRSAFDDSAFNSPCDNDCCYIGLDMLFQEFDDSLDYVKNTCKYISVASDNDDTISSSLNELENCEIEDLNSTYEWQSRAISNIQSYLLYDELASPVPSTEDCSLPCINVENEESDKEITPLNTTMVSIIGDIKNVEIEELSDDSGYQLKDSLNSPMDSLDDHSIKDMDLQSRSSLENTSTDSFLSEITVAFDLKSTSDLTTSSPTCEIQSFPIGIQLEPIDIIENDSTDNSHLHPNSPVETTCPKSHFNDIKTKSNSKKPKVDVAKNMMSSTAISASGYRVKRRQKENKQGHSVANTKTPTRHMKSYIALRMQCRMNGTTAIQEIETQKRNKTNKQQNKSAPVKTQPTVEKNNLGISHPTPEKTSPIKSPLISEEPQTVKSCTPLRSCVKAESNYVSANLDTLNENLRILKQSSNKRHVTPSGKRRTLKFATEYQVAYSRENIPAKNDQGFKSKERLARHWNIAKHIPRQVTTEKNPSFLNDSYAVVEDVDVDVDESFESHGFDIEQRAFAGQLRRWECEELASIP